MIALVPFDASDLSKAALRRAKEYADALGDWVIVAASVVPDDERYVRSRGWIDEGDGFSLERAAEYLEDEVAEIAPNAAFEHSVIGGYSTKGSIATELGSVIREYDPSIIFIGSDNVGRIATPVTSVGGRAASAGDYDVYVVRKQKPSEIEGL
ncbi:universal stress protein [Halorutilales archaeon Cl-col2-1]